MPPPRDTARDTASQALEGVIARFGGVVRTVAARYRLSPADRDDLIQEVRVRLWRALEAERIDAVPASYLYRTATSAALDIIRRRRHSREDAVDDLAPADSALTDLAPRPDQVAELSEFARRVQRAIDTIPESRRAVVRMYLAGYGSTEIGTLLGWTEGKARNLVYRGLADLRERLDDAGLGPRGA